MIEKNNLQQLLEAVLLAAGKPMTEAQLLKLFNEEDQPALGELRQALQNIIQSCDERGMELVELASGYQFQAKSEFAPWISKLWEERPAKYSRALLETLAIIAYRQPVTRGEIEEIRGVSISSSIFKTLLDDRGWIRVVGHKDVPGRPGLYATTKDLLDYFGLKNLNELPALPEIMNLELEIEFETPEEVTEEIVEEVAEEVTEELAEEPIANLA